MQPGYDNFYRIFKKNFKKVLTNGYPCDIISYITDLR